MGVAIRHRQEDLSPFGKLNRQLCPKIAEPGLASTLTAGALEQRNQLRLFPASERCRCDAALW